MPETWEPLDDAGQPLRNQALLDAMDAVAAEDTPGRRALLFQLLLDSTLIAVTSDGPDTPAICQTQPEEPLGLVTLVEDDGSEALPVFTSASEVLSWLPDGAAVVTLPGRDLLRMAAAAGTSKFVINMCTPPAFGYLDRHEIEALAKDRLPIGPGGDALPDGARVRIDPPLEPPSSLTVMALFIALLAEPAAEQAWFFRLWQDDSPPDLCIAVRMTPGGTGDQAEAALRAIVRRAASQSDETKALPFVLAHAGLRAKLEAGGGQLFFQRP